MKIELFLVLFAVAYAVAEPAGTCPEEDPATPVYYADTVDCFIFYECSNGKPLAITCPPGTNYDDSLHVCDTTANCGSRNTTPKGFATPSPKKI